MAFEKPLIMTLTDFLSGGVAGGYQNGDCGKTGCGYSNNCTNWGKGSFNTCGSDGKGSGNTNCDGHGDDE